MERRRLPETRESVAYVLRLRHADVNGASVETNVYIHVGLYEDGAPGEVFLQGDRLGSTLRGLLDALAVSISLGLQYGVPLASYTAKLRGMRFEPAGSTNHPDIRIATSIVDAVARWLDGRFGSPP